MNQLRDFWQSIANFFEHGDLTPFAVAVSVAHYIPVLTAHGEWWLIAALVGSLIDLLHFRTVRRAVTYRQGIDVAIAIVTTIMATAYHWRYYEGDWLLALPIPVGIAILAYHAVPITKWVSAEIHNKLLEANNNSTSHINSLSAQINDLKARVEVLTSANDKLTNENSHLSTHANSLENDFGALQRENKALSAFHNRLSNAPVVLLDIAADFAAHGKMNGSANKYSISTTDSKRIVAIVKRGQKQ